MSKSLAHWLEITRRHHLWGSLAIVIFTCWVIAGQIADRSAFANSDLHRDVMDRWGAPIVQPAPSVRFVPSGTVFNALHALPLSSQCVAATCGQDGVRRDRLDSRHAPDHTGGLRSRAHRRAVLHRPAERRSILAGGVSERRARTTWSSPQSIGPCTS